MSFLWALLLTVIIEGTVVLVLTRSIEWVKFNLYCNLVTNPVLNIALWIIAPMFGVNSNIPIMIGGELVVIATEVFFYIIMSKETLSKCIIISIVSNLISVLLGVALSMVL